MLTNETLISIASKENSTLLKNERIFEDFI